MQIKYVDVFDGKGMIAVAISHKDATRLYSFLNESGTIQELGEVRDYVQELGQGEPGLRCILSFIDEAISRLKSSHKGG